MELHGAILANPYDKVDMSNALGQALDAPANERASRIQRMSNIIHRYDVNAWGQDFLSSVTETD